MPDRHHIPSSDEDVCLAELDVARVADELRRSEDDEERLSILFELRTLVRGQRVFDGQIVEPELPLNFAQQLEARLVQTIQTN